MEKAELIRVFEENMTPFGEFNKFSEHFNKKMLSA